MSGSSGLEEAFERLRTLALGYPEATEHRAWDIETLIKVRNKTFLFLTLADARLSVSTKLPHSAPAALILPFARPTGYGLGRAGWVTATFDDGDIVPLAIIEDWLDESYRAIAPRRLTAGLADRTWRGFPDP